MSAWAIWRHKWLRRRARRLRRVLSGPYGRLEAALLGDRDRWIVLGDSHIEAIRAAARRRLIRKPCQFVEVAGATAIGLRNPNSQTDAMQIFAEALIPARPGATPVIHIGEVDCGFVIWYRAEKYGDGVEAQLARSIEAYFEFVDRLAREGYRRVVVTGATLPTIRDGQDWGEVANKRREVKASLRDRTALTMKYNDMLRAGAARRGLPFIDISPLLIDPGTGVIDDRYRHPDPRDHHLHPDRAAPLWAGALNGLDG